MLYILEISFYINIQSWVIGLRVNDRADYKNKSLGLLCLLWSPDTLFAGAGSMPFHWDDITLQRPWEQGFFFRFLSSWLSSHEWDHLNHLPMYTPNSLLCLFWHVVNTSHIAVNWPKDEMSYNAPRGVETLLVHTTAGAFGRPPFPGKGKANNVPPSPGI